MHHHDPLMPWQPEGIPGKYSHDQSSKSNDSRGRVDRKNFPPTVLTRMEPIMPTVVEKARWTTVKTELAMKEVHMTCEFPRISHGWKLESTHWKKLGRGCQLDHKRSRCLDYSFKNLIGDFCCGTTSKVRRISYACDGTSKVSPESL